jgi:hypothetical protein
MQARTVTGPLRRRALPWPLYWLHVSCAAVLHARASYLSPARFLRELMEPGHCCIGCCT